MEQKTLARRDSWSAVDKSSGKRIRVETSLDYEYTPGEPIVYRVTRTRDGVLELKQDFLSRDKAFAEFNKG